ncbi:sulfotransferase 1E1-like [Amblyomma americanum]
MDDSCLKRVDGVLVRKAQNEDVVRSAMLYQPRPDDLFVISYPKSGTSWTQYTVLSILSKGQPPKTLVEFLLAAPYLELMGAEAAEKLATRPAPMKLHMPFHKVPYSCESKYIYVARNPYDVCVSYYYHLRRLTPKTVSDVSFGKFHELFLAGQVPYGGYFEHILPWFGRRNSPNVFFFTYEQMKNDPTYWTLKIADFLGEEHGGHLRRDPGLLRKVIEASGMGNMKLVFNDDMRNVIKTLLELPPERALKSVQAFGSRRADDEMHDEEFVRSGVVGDWRSRFTPQQIEKTKAWVAEKNGLDIMQLWNDIYLP